MTPTRLPNLALCLLKCLLYVLLEYSIEYSNSKLLDSARLKACGLSNSREEVTAGNLNRHDKEK